MCGIVGVINGSTKFKSKIDEIFNEMLWIDQIRGYDGAGVFWYNAKENKYDVVKNADIGKVISDSRYESARKWMGEIPFMVGHNRAATRGQVSTENNHPFDEGNVVLVHNGTMNYIPKEYDNGTKVDSHAIAKMLHKATPEEFMKKSFGAFALVWFNKETRQLNLLRNEDRPLSLVEFEDVTLISSEAGLAHWLGTRFGLKFIRHYSLNPFFLYQFNQYDLNPIITDLTHAKNRPISEYNTQLPLIQRRSRGYGMYNEYGLSDEELEAAGEFAHRVIGNPSSTITDNVISMKDKLAEQKKRKLDGANDFFSRLNPYTYWYHINPRLKETEKPAPLPTVREEKHEGAKLILKVGEELCFGVDRATANAKKGFHSLVFGTIPGNPIQAFEVRAFTKSKVDYVKNSNFFWKGKIKALKHINHEKTMLVELESAVETDIPNPDFAIGVNEKNV